MTMMAKVWNRLARRGDLADCRRRRVRVALIELMEPRLLLSEVWTASGAAVASLQVQSPTTLAVDPSITQFNLTTTLVATLSAGETALTGRSVSFVFEHGDTSEKLGTVTTDAFGVATLPNVSLAAFHAGTYVDAIRASFAGDPTNAASTGLGDLIVAPAQATLNVGHLISDYDGLPHPTSVTTNPPGLAGASIRYAQNDTSVDGP